MGAYRDMGVSGTSFGISCRENSIDQDKSSDYLGAQADAGAVSLRKLVGSTAVSLVVRALESLHQPNSANSSQTLGYHVHHGSHQRHLPRQKQPERHCWVNMAPCIVSCVKDFYLLCKRRKDWTFSKFEWSWMWVEDLPEIPAVQ